jgi:hypothetical protein
MVEADKFYVEQRAERTLTAFLLPEFITVHRIEVVDADHPNLLFQCQVESLVKALESTKGIGRM